MDILDKREHKLRFRVNIEQIRGKDKWSYLKHRLETHIDIVPIAKQARSNCKLERNKNLALLNRLEGGLGGDDNFTNRQIRFRFYLKREWKIYDDIDIVLVIFNSDDGTDKWTYGDLDDLIQAFVKTFNETIEEEDPVSGSIEISPVHS